MLQNPCKTMGFNKNIVYKIPPGGGGEIGNQKRDETFHSFISENLDQVMQRTRSI